MKDRERDRADLDECAGDYARTVAIAGDASAKGARQSSPG